MELYQIKYYCVLCDTLHFGRAAERCGVSQPSLTRAVQGLERELGGLLIRRERGSTHLTNLGRLVRPMLEEVLAHLENVRTAAHRLLDAEGKSLRFGITPSVGPVSLAPFLARFGERYPAIELTFVEGEDARLEELLLGGNLDLAVATRRGPSNKRLRHHRLYRERAVVVFPAGHRFERQEGVRLVDLKGESFLLRSKCDKGSLLADTCRQHGFELNVVYRSEREDWIQMLVSAGRGVTLMPESLHLGSGTLARPLIEPSLNREISLITVAGRPYPPPVQHLLRATLAHQWGAAPQRTATELQIAFDPRARFRSCRCGAGSLQVATQQPAAAAPPTGAAIQPPKR
jgi:LysR family transcriptional regulator, hydrogen peroxide-inducible genes activator